MLKRNNKPFYPCPHCGVPVRERIVKQRDGIQKYLVEKFPPFGWRKHKCAKKKDEQS